MRSNAVHVDLANTVLVAFVAILTSVMIIAAAREIGGRYMSQDISPRFAVTYSATIILVEVALSLLGMEYIYSMIMFFIMLLMVVCLVAAFELKSR